jgi:hypothetical protein
MFVRACVGLPSAAAGVDDEAAAETAGAIDAAQSVVSLVADPDREGMWTGALRSVAERPDAHKLLAGRATRLLFDAGAYDSDETSSALSRAGSSGTPPAETAAWIEGFLGTSGTVLLHHEKLWQVLDAWVSGLQDEAFLEVLPLLRRTFSTFAKAERRQLGERVGGAASSAETSDFRVDEERAQRPLPLLRLLLGMGEPA